MKPDPLLLALAAVALLVFPWGVAGFPPVPPLQERADDIPGNA